IDFGRPAVMRHMMQENLGLVLPRRVEMEGGWQHALATNLLVEHVTVSLKTIDYVFPLYLYPDTDKKDLFSATDSHHRTLNINAGLLEALPKAFGKKPTPEEIFYYIYAILYSRTYRTRYAEFLKTDFPRVPFTKSHKLFLEMGTLGKQLVELHLLISPDIEHPAARFEGTGDNRVRKHRYSEDEQRVYINEAQYFDRDRSRNLGIPDRWLSGVEQMAEGPQGTNPQPRRHPALLPRHHGARPNHPDPGRD
ncbi:MAG: type ISP restriction/modification enzyme, partial [Candidatus Methylomirabilis sp.]